MPTTATVRTSAFRATRAPHVGRVRRVVRAIGHALVAGAPGAGWTLPYGAGQVLHERYERERRHA